MCPWIIEPRLSFYHWKELGMLDPDYFYVLGDLLSVTGHHVEVGNPRLKARLCAASCPETARVFTSALPSPGDTAQSEPICPLV